MSRHAPFTTLRSGPGMSHAIVPASSVEQWSAESAFEMLCEAMSSDEATSRALTDLARESGCDSSEPEPVARWLAEQIGRGNLVPVALDEWPPRSGRPILRREDVDFDWDNLTPLSDLGKQEPTLRFGWIALELVDHAGVPFAGYDVTLLHCDGRRDRIVLDDLGRHHVRSVPLPGPTLVILPTRVTLPKSAKGKLGVEAFQRAVDDVRMPCHPKSGIVLSQIDRAYRLVLEPPAQQPTLSYPSSLFATESALPTHAVADLVTRAQEIADSAEDAAFSVFGHADMAGGEDANKSLADRRAQAVYGVLTGDWEAFRSALENEDIPPTGYQMLLRALGCNPTAIDGELGGQTWLALSAFRRGYNAHTWHDERRARAYADLPDDDVLDDSTKQALLDAFHAEYSGMVPASRFLGPLHMGCGEFNPLSDEHTVNRRVTLVIYGQDAPTAEEFPCIRGDAAACTIDGGGRFTCKFYRERIREAEIEHELTPFWDFEWFKTLSNKAHLSALTHLPDSNEVEFVVRLVDGGNQPLEDSGHGAPPEHGEAMAVLKGVIRGGVAYALWDHGLDYNPFDAEQWFRESDAARGPWPLVFTPPIFTIEACGWWGYGDGPGVRPPRIAGQLQGIFVVQTDNSQILRVPNYAALHQIASRTHIIGITVAGHSVSAAPPKDPKTGQRNA